jgi:hypothetical protein
MNKRDKVLMEARQEAYIASLKLLSNSDLLELTLAEVCADEPTNTFSKWQEFVAEASVAELKRRLTEAGWLNQARDTHGQKDESLTSAVGSG